MAELQMFNIPGNFASGYGQGTAMRDDRRQQDDLAKQRALAPAIVGGDLAAYQDLAATDPAAAQQLQGAGDVTFKRLAGAYKLVNDAKQSGDIRAVNAALKQTAPFFSQVLGKPVPTEWNVNDPAWEEGWGKLGQQIAMAQSGIAPGASQNKVVGGALVDPNGNVIYQAPVNGQIVAVPDGSGGTIQMIFDPRTRQLSDLPPSGTGGAPAPAVSDMGNPIFTGPDGLPVAIDPSLPQHVQDQIRANAGGFQSAPDGSSAQLPESQVGGGRLGYTPPKPDITPYQQAQLDMQRERTDAANAAKEQAAAARRTADDLKASAKRQEAEARQNAANEAASSLISEIDALTAHPGFASLGTELGDLKLATPFIRNAAKDADAKLKNVAGQVALATLSRLKTLSASGATGFGSLTKPELDLVQNSIATLQSENISNAELTRSLKVIRDTMEKTTQWSPPTESSGKTYTVGQTVEHNGKVYRVVGGDPSDPELEEVQ